MGNGERGTRNTNRTALGQRCCLLSFASRPSCSCLPLAPVRRGVYRRSRRKGVERRDRGYIHRYLLYVKRLRTLNISLPPSPSLSLSISISLSLSLSLCVCVRALRFELWHERCHEMRKSGHHCAPTDARLSLFLFFCLLCHARNTPPDLGRTGEMK